MQIPLHINPIDFFNATEKKGIKITSRYKGVYLFKSAGRNLKWRAALSTWDPKTGKKDHVYFGIFPFTHTGEKEAAIAYEKGRAEYEQKNGPLRAYKNPKKQG